MAVPALAVPMARLLVRTFDMGGGVGAKDRELPEASPLLAVLSTDRDDLLDWLHVAQARQSILLVGCRHGLQASYLNQPIQVASLRPKLQKLVGDGFPQILLRIGHLPAKRFRLRREERSTMSSSREGLMEFDSYSRNYLILLNQASINATTAA